MDWKTRTVAASALLALLPGCSGMYRYDAERDKLAADTLKRYRDAKLPGMLQQERSNLDALEQHEVASVRLALGVQRDNDLLFVFAVQDPLPDPVRKKPDEKPGGNAAIQGGNARGDGMQAGEKSTGMVARLGELVTARHGVLTKADFTTFDAQSKTWKESALLGYMSADEQEQSSATEVATAIDNWSKVNVWAKSSRACTVANQDKFVVSVAGVTSMAGATPPSHLVDSAVFGFRAVVDACTLHLANITATKQAADALGGELGASVIALRAAQLQAEHTVEDVKVAKAKLASAAEAVAEVQGTPDDTPANVACKERKKEDKSAHAELCRARENFKRLGPHADKLIAKETLAEIQEALDQLADGTTAGQTATGRYAWLPLSVQLQDALNEGSPTPADAVSALLIEKQLQEGYAAAAQRSLDVEQRRLALRRERFNRLLAETYELEKAHALLSPHAGQAAASAHLLLASKSAPQQRAYADAYRAAQAYAQSIDKGRIPAEVADTQLRAIPYREALDQSLAALAAWDGLLAVPLENLAAYHAGGIKPEQVAQWLQAIGTLATAYRVR